MSVGPAPTSLTMTEADWLTSTSESAMRSHLWKVASERKLRLYACACTRRVWPFVKERGRQLIEAVERFSDETSTQEELATAREGVWDEGMPEARGGDWQYARQAAWYSADDSAWTAAAQSACMAYSSETSKPPWPDIDHSIRVAVYQAQCQLLRDIFGNPFRPVILDPVILDWNGNALRRIAQAIYAERCFSDLPVLADALEDAGCAGELMEHLRGPGPHVRGCHVIDALTGRS
jgi:hypothetical protein